MATKSSVILKYLGIFNEIRDLTNEIVDLKNTDEDDLADSMLFEYEVFIDSLKHLLSVAIDNAPYDLLDAEITAKHAEEINTRNVPVEPYNRARYVLKRMKSDYERYLKCRRYNIAKGVDIKNKQKIKYPYKMTKAEYYDVQRDYGFIKQKLESDLKKHRPVFEELFMKDMTLQEYAECMNKSGSVQYKIKWAYNKRESFIKALGRQYISEMSSMNYYDGIQDEGDGNGREFYMLEREMVCDALERVDIGEEEYFQAMKNAYDEIYKNVVEMRKEKNAKN